MEDTDAADKNGLHDMDKFQQEVATEGNRP